MPSRPTQAPRRFHLLAKPAGSSCNIDCTYCFYLSKQALYPDEPQRMTDATLEQYLRQLFESQQGSEITVAWQGGEPTLMGLEFFRRSVEFVGQIAQPHQRVQHTFQTNGIALDDEWCAFLAEHQMLVGLSIDGPREVHDAYRVTRGGKGTFDMVAAAWRRLRAHGVEVNAICSVHAANQDHGRRVYRFLRDDLGATWMQFIAVVERATPQSIVFLHRSAAAGGARPLYTQHGTLVTERSVTGSGYGQFIIDVFEEWVRRDIGTVFVQTFDVTLEAFFGRHTLCVHAPTCGDAPVLEFNGDLYACDHFVEPDWLLGNIHRTHMLELMASDKQRRFGLDKNDTLTRQCQECDVRALCNGGCPKDRFAVSRDGEPGHNHLCEGYLRFYAHTQPVMQAMADLLSRRQAPAAVMTRVRAEDTRRGAGAPCTCGSGRTFGQCHGSSALPPIAGTTLSPRTPG